MKNDFISAMESMIVLDNTLKYLPYTMSATILGFSDIWMGTRILLDETTKIPLFRDTVWRITELSQNLSDNQWTTTFTAICEYNKSLDELNEEFKKYGKIPNVPSNFNQGEVF